MSNAPFAGGRRRLIRCAAALALAWAAAPLAAAGLRYIPAAARRAEMQPPQGGLVQLGSTVHRLAVTAQIRDPHNRIVMPVAVQRPVLVRFLLDNRGDVSRVWILTAEEAAQPEAD